MDTLENAQKRAEYWKAEHAAANAEIELLRQGDTCGRMCEATAYRTELRRLQRMIVAHVNASNNDDSAGETFGAMMKVAASVPNGTKLTGALHNEHGEANVD